MLRMNSTMSASRVSTQRSKQHPNFTPWYRRINLQRAINHPACKSMLPYTCFAIYLTVGSAVLYAIEVHATSTFNYRRSKRLQDCIAGHDYWAAFFYVIAATSTIGFGNVYPCTNAGRVVSTIYSIIGIPMVVYIISNLGKQMCKAGTNLLSRANRHKTIIKLDKNVNESTKHTTKHSSVINKDSGTESESDKSDDPDIPISVGWLLTLACVGLMGVYYYTYEGYNIEDSTYYAFMTFLGGDFVTQNFDAVAAVYLTIFVGFSMLSLTISMFQSNMEKFVARLKAKLLQNVQEKIAASRAAELDPSAINVQSAVDDALQNAKAPWWLKSAIPQQEVALLVEAVGQAVNKRDHGLQVRIASPTKRSFQTQAECTQTERCALNTTDTQTAAGTDQPSQTHTPNGMEVSTATDALILTNASTTATPCTSTTHQQFTTINHDAATTTTPSTTTQLTGTSDGTCSAMVQSSPMMHDGEVQANVRSSMSAPARGRRRSVQVMPSPVHGPRRTSLRSMK